MLICHHLNIYYCAGQLSEEDKRKWGGGGELRFPYLVTCRIDIYFLVKVCAITTDGNTYDLY